MGGKYPYFPPMVYSTVLRIFKLIPVAEMHINLGSLYGMLTLWRDGFSQNQQNEQLYGEEHFMAERWSALWRRGTNFMDKILKGGVLS